MDQPTVDSANSKLEQRPYIVSEQEQINRCILHKCLIALSMNRTVTFQDLEITPETAKSLISL